MCKKIERGITVGVVRGGDGAEERKDFRDRRGEGSRILQGKETNFIREGGYSCRLVGIGECVGEKRGVVLHSMMRE